MRRAVLTIAVAALLVAAGCVGTAPESNSGETTVPDESTDATAVTKTPDQPTTGETTTHESMGSDGYYRAYTVRATSTSVDAVAAEIASSPSELRQWNPEEASLVQNAAANGSASRIKMGREVKLGLVGELVAVNGSYSRVTATVDWRETVTAHNVDAEGPLGNRYNESVMAATRERAVNYTSLSASDRRLVEQTIGIADEPFRNFHGIGYWHYFENGTVPEKSVFADGETRVVRYNGTLWQVTLNPDQTSQQVRYRASYGLETVAANESAWHEYVRQHNVTTLDDLSVGPDAREVVADAIRNGSVEWEGTAETEPPRFRQLSDHSPLFYVVRNGAVYRITVQKVME